MLIAVYNSGIPEANLKPVTRAFRSASILRPSCLLILFATLGMALHAGATDWSGPEQELARKIVAVTGPGAVAVTIENRSSLARRDAEVIQAGLRGALEAAGIRFVKSEQAAATVAIVLSENPTAYVWVAQVRQGTAETEVVLVSIARFGGSVAAHDSMPITLRKVPLWAQDDPILDVAVLEESSAPTHIAVLGPRKVSLYRLQGGKWMEEQAMEIAHAKSWPRDLRGRLIAAKDHLFDVYMPGVLCHTTSAVPLALNCMESDDPWPLVTPALSVTNSSLFPGPGSGNGPSTVISPTKSFFASSRNFFTGALTPAVGKFTTVPKFYSAAAVPREKYTLWLFSAIDSRVHLIDGVSDQTAIPGWGSDLANIRTACGAGWQILATTPGTEGRDSIRAYEFPDRDPVAVSAAIDFPGEITALWTEPKGDTAVAVIKNQETGSYEAFQLAVACGQ